MPASTVRGQARTARLRRPRSPLLYEIATGCLFRAGPHDGGRTFETLTRGLPQEHAYDLVYRHGLDVEGDGEPLAFGSTTGSLYVSESAGNGQCLSEHLPPIYALRFA